MADGNLDEIKEAITQMEERMTAKLTQLSEQQERSTLKVEQLHSCVVGSPSYGIKGLVVRMEDAESDLKDYKSVKQKSIGAMAILTIVWALFIDFLKTKIMN